MATYEKWKELHETYDKFHGKRYGIWAMVGAVSNYLTDEQVDTIIARKLELESEAI